MTPCDDLRCPLSSLHGFALPLPCRRDSSVSGGFVFALFGHRRSTFGGPAADPTADVEGFDVQAKIALLTKLAFGATVPSESVREDLKRKEALFFGGGREEVVLLLGMT